MLPQSNSPADRHVTLGRCPVRGAKREQAPSASGRRKSGDCQAPTQLPIATDAYTWHAVQVKDVEPNGASPLSEAARRWFADRDQIDRYCESKPETYAGRWTEGGTSLVLAFTDDVATHLDEIRELLNDPKQVSVVQVRRSYRDLMALRDRVVSILGTTDGLVTWGLDVKGNCVLVRAVSEHLDEVRRTLMATNPEDVRVEVGERPIIPT
jgi:hypothetical protein